MSLTLAGSERVAVLRVARAVAEAGGRAFLVGGWVRDGLLGRPCHDLDLEVHGLEQETLEKVLRQLGPTFLVGRSFPVWLVRGLPVQISYPRAEGFDEAARHRDLRVNAMGFDPLSEELVDPLGGRRDLEARILRAADPQTFGVDPLRALRVARFAAMLEMTPDPALLALCRAADLGAVTPERKLTELEKILGVEKPSRAFEIIVETDLLRFFPPLAALVDVPQDPEWHPEGDVWVHTLLVLDEAARLRTGNADEDRLLMLGALCHDLGKARTTLCVDGRVRSPGHDEAGVDVAGRWLHELRAPAVVVEAVEVLVRTHLAPALLDKAGASAKAYRRLARRLDAAGVSAGLLGRVARADHFGRTTPEAVARLFPAGDTFRERMDALLREERPAVDVVLGRHVLARGIDPGPRVGEILARCRDVQDETGWSDPERILTRAMTSSCPDTS